jgi:hypothetical protein
MAACHGTGSMKAQTIQCVYQFPAVSVACPTEQPVYDDLTGAPASGRQNRRSARNQKKKRR